MNKHKTSVTYLSFASWSGLFIRPETLRAQDASLHVTGGDRGHHAPTTLATTGLCLRDALRDGEEMNRLWASSDQANVHRSSPPLATPQPRTMLSSHCVLPALVLIHQLSSVTWRFILYWFGQPSFLEKPMFRKLKCGTFSSYIGNIKQILHFLEKSLFPASPKARTSKLFNKSLSIYSLVVDASVSK